MEGSNTKSATPPSAASGLAAATVSSSTGAAGATKLSFIKQVFKKGGKNNGQLHLDDLDEKLLKEKLDLLTKELNEIKTKCEKYKQENTWYRSEIDISQRDNQEYITYLDSKKQEKLSAISKLAQGNKRDLELFGELKERNGIEHEKKITEYQDTIVDLELKLSSKEDEFLQLSDTMQRRARHYEELGEIREEIKNAELNHQDELLSLEKKLLDTRIRLQRESDEKIKEMESAAEEKAARYLADHSEQIQKENTQLERQLGQMTLKTSRLLSRKDQLFKEIEELEREAHVRRDLVGFRLRQVAKAEEGEGKRREERRRSLAKKRGMIVEKLLAGKGMGDAMPLLDQAQWLDISDDDD